MKQELMRPELDSQDFIKFNYWDGGRKGLLAGEALHLDVKRMEMAYLENNKREIELTRHVSLRQLDPIALLTLKATGSCTVTIYVRQGSEDDRFVDFFGAVQSIVTSTAANDSGMFETNLRDERFLPFEGAGAESTWKPELPRNYHAFDYATISDVVLHVRYTARQGVDSAKVVVALNDLFQEAGRSGLALLFSLRHDFPSEWAAVANGDGEFTATVRRDHFPYFTHGRTITITELEIYREDMTKHHAIGNAGAATASLSDNNQFTLGIVPDGPGPGQVLTRTPGANVFLVIKYLI